MSDASPFAAYLLWAAAGGLSLVLAGRALAGAFDEPVVAAVPLAATLLTLSGGLIAWTLFHRHGRRGDVGKRLWDGLLSLLPAAVAGFVAAGHAAPATLAGVTCLIVLGLSYVVIREGTRIAVDSKSDVVARTVEPHSKSSLSQSSPDEQDNSNGRHKVEETHVERHGEAESTISLQVTRLKQPDGSEQIEAVCSVHFDSGERETRVHLPIHPVLRTPPTVEAEPLDDAEISVRPTDVHGYGVALTVRRDGPILEAAETSIGVMITAPAARRSAA